MRSSFCLSERKKREHVQEEEEEWRDMMTRDCMNRHNPVQGRVSCERTSRNTTVVIL